MLKKVLIICASLSLAVAAQASVTVGAAGVTNLVLSSSGTALGAGDLIRLGYFSSTSLLGTDNSFSDLNSIFTAIGEGVANAGTLTESGNSGTTLDIDNFGTTGGFFGQYTGVSSTYLTTGVQLYMWVFNATSFGSATQWGIFDASSWTFPADPGTVTLNLGSSGVTAIRGSSVVMNGTTDFELANVGAVPEPSSLAGVGSIVVVGAAAVLRRRRSLA